MPKTSRTKTSRTKTTRTGPTKRKGELPVREAAEQERDVTRGEPDSGTDWGGDVERDTPVHRSSERPSEHQD